MLWMPLMVNETHIGQLTVGHQDRDRPWPPDEATVSRYRWRVQINDDTYNGYVSHRYGDGALVLIARVLDQIPDVRATLSAPPVTV